MTYEKSLLRRYSQVKLDCPTAFSITECYLCYSADVF